MIDEDRVRPAQRSFLPHGVGEVLLEQGSSNSLHHQGGHLPAALAQQRRLHMPSISRADGEFPCAGGPLPPNDDHVSPLIKNVAQMNGVAVDVVGLSKDSLQMHGCQLDTARVSTMNQRHLVTFARVELAPHQHLRPFGDDQLDLWIANAVCTSRLVVPDTLQLLHVWRWDELKGGSRRGISFDREGASRPLRCQLRHQHDLPRPSTKIHPARSSRRNGVRALAHRSLRVFQVHLIPVRRHGEGIQL
mmetsp:Transcript_56745/g.151515  ORF Transcript_56745/g.151515 Transcript_56745/m.151515 type:complete len:247 (+) Transcript_56745:1113-1853(+)